jgi:xylan 1,4-beta-xylosidase
MMTRHHMLLRFSGEWSVLIERGVNMASRSAQSATFRLRRVGNIRSAGLLASVALACSSPTASAQQHGDPVAPFPVSIKVDAGQSLGALPPAWRFFGADEPNYVTMKDGRKLIAELGSLRRDKVFFRTHNLLNTGDGTSAFKWGSTDIYKEDANGHPIYDWTVVDRIIDTYRAAGVRPYLQLGFMPRALSTAPADVPYQHSWRPGFRYDLISGGWAYPPKNYDKWAELIYQWTLHNVKRYGRNEVENWYFEVWNEPNGPAYWKGTREEFYKLYDYAVTAVRRALPTARVGGPETAGPGGAMMDGFLAHVTTGRNAATGATGSPTDFLSFHAKGKPEFVEGHVRMGIARHLQQADAGFAKVANGPAALRTKPIVIGESDPEGCAACPGPQNAYRNGTMYSSYTAASMARIWDLARKRNVTLEGMLAWSFTFEDQPWFAGYRQLATNGIGLPVLSVFRLMAMLQPERIAASSDHQVPLEAITAAGVRAAPDVGALATRGPGGRIDILVWHYHDDDLPGPDASIRLSLAHGGSIKRATVWKVDRAHANAYAAWQAMGSPQSPDEHQYATLEAASKLSAESLAPVKVKGGNRMIEIRVPRQGVALVELN